MNPEDPLSSSPEDEAEQRYRDEAVGKVAWWWLLGALCFFSFLPACGAAYWVTGSEVAATIVAGIWMAWFLVCGACLGVISCPRCKGLLFVGKTSLNLLTSECLQCGLPLRNSRAMGAGDHGKKS